VNSIPEELLAALYDDLNTPEAFVILARLASAARRQATSEHKKAAKQALLGAGAFLGLLQQDPEAWFTRDQAEPDLVTRLRLARRRARAAKNFALADDIRRELESMGITIKDRPDGTEQVNFSEHIVDTVHVSDTLASKLAAFEQVRDQVGANDE
jgi:cysteinyl-tRNA synthetase